MAMGIGGRAGIGAGRCAGNDLTSWTKNFTRFGSGGGGGGRPDNCVEALETDGLGGGGPGGIICATGAVANDWVAGLLGAAGGAGSISSGWGSRLRKWGL